MPTTEDDFGRVGLKLSLKAPGACQPVHCIGGLLHDLPADPPPQPRDPELRRGCMDAGTVHCQQGFPSRRLLGTVHDLNSGEVVRKNRPSSGRERPSGMRQIDFKPSPLREGSKRCYDWTNGPSGYQNPIQWEDSPAAGPGATGAAGGSSGSSSARPSHPVSSTGVVALEHKRAFPALQHRETANPGKPRLAQAPDGSWGGWGRRGEPGRKLLVQPWDSLKPRNSESSNEVDYRMSDASRKPFPHLMYSDTRHLTRWHLDPKDDIDPITTKRVHVNTVLEARGAAGVPAIVMPKAAGQPSRAPVEGSALSWYDSIRAAELAGGGGRAGAAPHTAR